MRMALILTAMLGLASCAGGPVQGSPVGGVASYDALKVARDACLARNGELVMLPETSGKRMADYTCKRK